MAIPRALTGPVAGPALPISGVLLALAAAAAGFGAAWAGAALALLAALNLAFFRNPRRTAPAAGVLAPADGRVVEVVQLQDPGGFVGSSTRIAIFLSVLDVHVNRAPLSAKVRAVRRSGSQYLAAFNAGASALNVQCRLDLETADGMRLAVVQITGLIARRILCYAQEGDGLERGLPYGLICYGSRMELYLPAALRVTVRPGDRVRAGESLLAEDPEMSEVDRPSARQSRRDARRRRRQRVLGEHPRAVLLLPNLVTTGALTLGFWSITQSIGGHFNTAAWGIIVAGVLDTLDGRIARATHSTTRFGIEYDSLVDVVCYGVAPAILVYVWALEPLLGGRAWPIAALFPICAALRLARFNAQVNVPRDHYVGMPSTAGGALLSVTRWFVDWTGADPGASHWVGGLLAAGYVTLALLMVSPVPYPSWKSLPLVRAHAFSALVGVVLTLLLVLVNGEPALFLMALLYVASGPALFCWLRRQAARAAAAGEENRAASALAEEAERLES